MKRALFGLAAALCVAGAIPAHAQSGQGALRRFTEHPTDTNRNNRVAYVPLGWSFSGQRPGSLPYDVSVATWYQLPIHTTHVKPDKVLDSGTYRVERFDVVGSRPGESAQLRVVITRQPAPPVDAAPPRIQIVHGRTGISSLAFASAEALPDGVRYTFVAEPPQLNLAMNGGRPDTDRYEVRLMPAREVSLPQNIARAPTFGGEDIQTRQAMAPPRLPREERVAGKRIEYRNGKVIERRKR